ncbi:MAG: hypothetical protein JWQ87_1985 [Candidatus Sulfotelmatobacter sp.]|nr:hypothetical protein [Candidatus Sulfotelmatobacter sp.]
MRIYIDEAGAFIPPQPPRPLFSIVLSLIIPSATEHELFYEFLHLRDTWPNQNVEIKGRSLDESQAAQIISLVLKYDTLVQFIALDTNTHPDNLVEDFKNRQADAVTANITREHHPGPIPHLHQLGEEVRQMSNQLFLQALATWELIIRTIREGTVYFVQRQPEELGDIAWVIDRKYRTLTQMEETWSTLILPLSEGAFAKVPLVGILEEDYSYFDAKYGFNRATIEPEDLRHLQWLHSVSGKGPLREDERLGVNAQLLLTEQRTFEDSRDSLGLQLADMLATILRRALNDQLQYPGWKDFGGLLVRHHNPGTGFIQFGGGEETLMTGHARNVCKVLDSKAKSMVGE